MFLCLVKEPWAVFDGKSTLMALCCTNTVPRGSAYGSLTSNSSRTLFGPTAEKRLMNGPLHLNVVMVLLQKLFFDGKSFKGSVCSKSFNGSTPRKVTLLELHNSGSTWYQRVLRDNSRTLFSAT